MRGGVSRRPVWEDSRETTLGDPDSSGTWRREVPEESRQLSRRVVSFTLPEDEVPLRSSPVPGTVRLPCEPVSPRRLMTSRDSRDAPMGAAGLLLPDRETTVGASTLWPEEIASAGIGL